ncbi:uncharacterized protein K452DRAFT_323015 [Aplosporella prunicola CBS 121167]|uniref:GYF domain-containing protein n=1 Tax=Aplosporella prunicola CBS 121167 TaxID=1176127 RepID=A0A6A6AYA5_9PEZI|nr:uncharacterized protein K452DRAFT_323015 [Aplosporella prunicola CBS 121167]KAF2135521.1 hypothetical protein K452DRAFT_323015 [Aplosporella prunicola CBS 121167]
MAPSTFASAAAGSNSNANTTRADTGGEWSRRANGATQTFRRPSHAASLSNAAAATTSASSPGVYVPPHRNGAIASETRYPRDQLLSLFRQHTEDSDDGLADLYAGSWEPNSMNGASGTSWGRSHDHAKENQPGAEVCWEREGHMQPVGLVDLTNEEKEHFLSVNSPLKIPNPTANKDNNAKDGITARKTSVSHSNGPGTFGVSSPTTNRPGTRRRDTGEAYPFPATGSPASSRFTQESNAAVPPPALLRRRTDYKEPTASPGPGQEERDKDKAEPSANPFGSLKRSATGPFSAGISGPSSPWSAGPQSAGFSPMGSFGSFAIGGTPGQASTPTEKKPGLPGLRGESRFKGLMSKESSEDMQRTLREKASLNSLGRVNETEQGRQTPSWMEARANRPMSNDTDPYLDDDNMRAGSAALGGGQDSSPPRRQMTGFGTPNRQDSRDESGFSAFGMTTDNTGLGNFLRDPYGHHTPQHHGNEPMSPTDTNPYQSPEHEKPEPDDLDTDGSDIHNAHLPGLGGFMSEATGASGMPAFGGLGGLSRVSNAYEGAASDRSQTSSVGANRGFPSLGGLAGLPGLGGPSAWASNQPAVGTPGRERFGAPFQEGGFGSVGEMQSPSLAGLGSSNIFGGGIGPGLSGTGSIGRGSKLGSLFPAAMQEQMRASEQNRFASEDGSVEGSDRQHGTFGRNAFGGAGPQRDTGSPFRAGRGVFDDLLANNQQTGFMEGLGPFGAASSSALQTPTLAASHQQNPLGQRNIPQGIPGQGQPVSSSASNQPPAAQQRTMVMPDRMRWIYRDPQGNTQGPWSGLEMHDWYKAGFFSPELLVKKFEDPEYEPLAQLIRRIGNSREPFLVPQIGIPHGPPSTQPGNAWAGAGIPAGVPSSGGAQPPFASSFPSFGTTLTAEQQNALERRKQEEQYLMARQKEHLAQQQVLVKQMQMGAIHPQQLHHHSSAHSLHSQPSFGSITSPGGYQPSPAQGAIPGGQAGFFDNSFRSGPASAGLPPIGAGMEMLGNIREEEMPGMLERLNLGRGAQMPFGAAPGAFGAQHQDSHAQQVAAMLNDRARLHREQVEHDARAAQNESQANQDSANRLQQFNDLRSPQESEDAGAQASTEGGDAKPTSQQEEHQQTFEEEKHEEVSAESEAGAPVPQPETPATKPSEPLSLTEQVKAASAKQTPAPQSPWAKVDTTMPMPFPPPQSGSPLPAPAAQRKQNLADALNAESRSRSQTPSVETPSASIAPWAKETTEAPKGPSLKEIQEAEAKKAAEAEAAAAAARREAFEKEMIAQAQASQPAPGLPSTSTWASGASPVNTPSTPSAWAKPATVKTPGTPGTKKTLQQIQKEEEARKQRAAAAAAASAATANAAALSQAMAAGKRYADLASKQAAPANAGSAPGGAWTTVGASGKVKAPAVVIPTGPAATRSVSSSTTPVTAKAKTVAPARAGTASTPALNAQEEFKKWATNELRTDLNKGINAEEVCSILLACPLELEVVTEAVHGVSQTIDSRHFAEEFIRRKKLADKGIVDTSGTSSPGPMNGSGGWNEVAKKGGAAAQTSTQAQKEDVAFKVVAAKKKGGRK